MVFGFALDEHFGGVDRLKGGHARADHEHEGEGDVEAGGQPEQGDAEAEEHTHPVHHAPGPRGADHAGDGEADQQRAGAADALQDADPLGGLAERVFQQAGQQHLVGLAEDGDQQQGDEQQAEARLNGGVAHAEDDFAVDAAAPRAAGRARRH